VPDVREPDRSAAPDASVIIPCYRSAATLARCLESLRGQTTQRHEVIVVNSSQETETRRVAEAFPEVRFEQSQERLLPHAARNAGVALARGRYFVFTDPDCRAAPDWLEWLYQAHASGHGVVTGAMDVEPRHRLPLGIHICKFWWALPGASAGRAAYAPTANVSYARAVFERSGPFDGRYFVSDGLLGLAVAADGESVYFEPRARVVHRHDETVTTFLRQRAARGREFGRLRSVQARFSRARRLAMLGFPFAAALVSARAALACRRAGWLAAFLGSLPIHVLGQLAWCLGEAGGAAEAPDA
jgi:glycosyltransferase involved in cell wall biosynthesis